MESQGGGWRAVWNLRCCPVGEGNCHCVALLPPWPETPMLDLVS